MTPPTPLGPDEGERFYPDQLLDEHDRLAPDDAHRRGTYVRAITIGDATARLELVADRSVLAVIYLDRAELDATALAQHRARYAGLGFTVRHAVDGGSARVSVDRDADGALLGSEEETFDEDGRVVMISRRDADGALLGTIEQAWSADGELVRAIERNPDGRVVQDFDATA